MATEPQPDPTPAPDGSSIVVRGKPGSVSVERVGAKPVVYTGEGGKPGGAPVDSVAAALDQAAHPDAKDPTLLLGMAVQPLDQAYGARSDARETAGLEQQLADLDRQDAHQAAAEGKLRAVAGDIAKGTMLEGGQAVLAGAQHAVNNTLDLVEHIADQIPGPIISWGDTDGNPATNNGLRVDFQSGADFKKQNTGIKRFLPTFSINPKDEPTTTTGKIIEGAEQFGTGMLGAGKVLKGWTVGGASAGQIGKALAQGAMATSPPSTPTRSG
jgi:hypothetical protein